MEYPKVSILAPCSNEEQYIENSQIYNLKFASSKKQIKLLVVDSEYKDLSITYFYRDCTEFSAINQLEVFS